MGKVFTRIARRAMFSAQEEAAKRGNQFVSPEHLLLALLQDEKLISARLIARMGLSCQELCAVLEPQIERSEPPFAPFSKAMHLTPAAHRAVDLAYTERQTLGEGLLGTEHLLLGIVTGSETPAAQVLAAAGVDLERTRRALVELHNTSTNSAP